MSSEIRIGIDIGAVTIGLAVLRDGRLASKSYRFHHGNIKDTLADVLAPLDCPRALVGLTGRGARAFAGLGKINDVVAAVEGVKWGAGKIPQSLLLVGGENIYLIKLAEDGSYSGHEMNTDCASGTGVFLDQQAGRLGLSSGELSRLAQDFDGLAPAIATRCAVFAKTDLIHCQQQGHSPSGIAAGLCDGVARSLAESLIKDPEASGDLCLAGGVALNGRVVAALEKLLGKKIQVVKDAEVIPAIGAAVLAGEPIDLERLRQKGEKALDPGVPLNPALVLSRSDYPDFSSDLTWREGDIEVTLYEELTPGRPYRVNLGLDIGSTSTKLAVMEGERVLIGLYTYTRSAPVEAVQRLFKILAGLEERHRIRFEFLAAGTTGSGRQLIGKLVHADLIINEISAHARAAKALDAAVDTVIEIGGQDSKFIRLQNGAVVQAIMNYICAAGTGSFIEEQAQKLNVPLAEYAGLALGKRGPVISDRCTVYMERDLSRLLAEGWPKDELMAAVLHSVRDNYLMRVVGQAKVGERICFQGATAKNKALVAAFEVALQKPIRVSRFCHLTGAMGVGLLLHERMKGISGFVGLEFASSGPAQKTEVCTLCANRCQITLVEVGPERAAWGFQCGREYEDTVYREKRLPFESIYKAYSRARDSSRPHPLRGQRRRETIGIPRALPLVEYLPFWQDFFSCLGFRVVVSPQEKDILKYGKRAAQAEFCSPILLAHGHVDWLQKKDLDLIFFPIMLQGPRRDSKIERSFFCYYTSYTPVVLHNSPLFRGKKNLFFPLVDLQVDPEKTAGVLRRSLGRALRIEKRDIRRALDESYARHLRLKEALLDHGDKLLAEIENRDEKAVVILGRPYNILDRSLNHGIPEIVQQSGLRVLTQDMIRLESLMPEFTGDYLHKVHWNYGKKILHATEAVLRNPRLFPVFITNFRCSPDAFIMSYFKELMERQARPYLILQLDELSTEVGYQTRIEAALESFRNWKPQYPHRIKPFTFIPLRKDRTWVVPHLDDSATVLARAVLERFGYDAVVSEETPESSVQGLKLVGGGECIPVAAVLGGLIATVKKHRLDPGRTAAVIPTSLLGCNFPQIPLAVQMGLKKAGLEELRVFTNDLTGQRFNLPMNLAFLKTYIMGSLINQMAARVRAEEARRGETERVKAESLEKISAAIVGKGDLLDTFRGVVKEFAAVKQGTADGARPLLVILGDLYVTSNSAFNREVEKVIEGAGGRALPSSFIDLSYFSYLNKIEKSLKDRNIQGLAEAKAMNAFVRFHDLQFRKAAAPVLDGIHPLMEGDLLKSVRGIGIPPELGGESAQNALKIFYYLRHLQPDGFVHLNPLYCCPGLVSRALLGWVEREFGVPMIHLFYDGIHNPNENLEPYIYYLRKKKEAAAGKAPSGRG